MGKLVDGTWVSDSYAADIPTKDGHFVRAATSFRNWIRADGSTPYAPESGRYHLYISSACPWAHRTLVFRVLKKLESHVTVSNVEALAGEHGWEFSARYADPIESGTEYLYQVYQRADPHYSGRATVPVLWDRQTHTVVSNESSEIIRMFNGEFAGLTGDDTDYYPARLGSEIDAVNERVYHTVNNGVYRAGFARTQEAYDQAVSQLFETLDELEARLLDADYLVGDAPTEADWRLYTTLVRFDPVYHTHFKCNRRRLRDYPQLLDLTRRLHATPGIAELFDLDYVCAHYYGSHRSVNPRGIVPVGPALHLE